MTGKRRHRRPASKGVVLVMVLWLMLAMGLLALSFSSAIRTEVNAATNVVDLKESYYLARAGIEYTTYKIMEAQSAFAQAQASSRGLAAPPAVFSGNMELAMGGGRARVQVIDETGKININQAPGYLIYNLLIMIGLDEQEADVITDSIEDWRDPDELHRLNGAETDYYGGLEEPYTAKNGLFDVPEELMLVRGVTPEVYYGIKATSETGDPVEFYGLQKYVTSFSNFNRINVNSAPFAVLAALPGLDYEMASQIYMMRQAGTISNVSEIMERIPGIPTEATGLLSTVRSNIYTLISEGHLDRSQVVNRIRCVVRVDPVSQRGYTTLYWNESNIEL